MFIFCVRSHWNYGMLPQTWEDPASKNAEAGGVFVSAVHLKKGMLRVPRVGSNFDRVCQGNNAAKHVIPFSC